MKTSAVAGVILIVIGVIALVFQGITYTKHKKVLQVGSFQATTEQHKTIPVPPIIGGIAVVAGVVLLVAGRKPT
jgi:UDP-N-acetylmuramyl pentapeptide phosphotransferase/UDP-N-acetylglucosamine-1-phosphate transferase